MSCAEMEKNNSCVRAGEHNNETVQYFAEPDRNLTALRKEPISVPKLGLVHRRYGRGVYRDEVVQMTVNLMCG